MTAAQTFAAFEAFLKVKDAKLGKPPWQGIAPSPIAFRPGALVPREMDRDDIRAVIAAHVDATKRSGDAGFST